MVGEKFFAQKPPRKRYSLCFQPFYCQFSDSAEGGRHSNSNSTWIASDLCRKVSGIIEDAEVETLFYTADTAVTSVRERDVPMDFGLLAALTCTNIFNDAAPTLVLGYGNPEFQGEALANYPEFDEHPRAGVQLFQAVSSIIWEDVGSARFGKNDW